ncbi:fumarylacetoacetate hydrolase family protein [Penicillium cosmopolitanum]|uniref:Fumarylacetoacetate hydrolase family protein n=1 Tax=Penicillium cosmopolitanum TaxID=1131564 RepID=A0A9W9VXN5_9EURO|nr:fumarylacetoacetate hydrolase family protein [Penicillium cosmopolitanum]KAJ5391151.1 fumarylacetoacetate hydrolase family protein [Penicillium cosmopolitanum]
MTVFKRLVRFASPRSGVHYGDLLAVSENKYTVRRLEGNPFTGLKATEETLKVNSLECPLESTPIVLCIGLNYKQHAEEANLTVPKYPVIFTKPADALAGPFEKINIHADAREFLDYEGELTVVIGKDAKDVTEDTALDYVLGYTAGNDLSARNFQLPENSGGQYCYAKSFDKFAPIGHAIVAAEEIHDPQALRLTTKVNGVVKQETSTADMIWTVRQLITHLSRGTTLRKGTLIMTGTPSGVGFFRKEFLQNDDVVEVEIEGVASTKNCIHHG